MDSKIDFEIIDLKTGNRIISKNFKFAYYATWYDDKHVLFAFQEFVKIPNPAYSDLSKLNKNKKDLIHERQILTTRYKRGETSKEEFIKRKDEVSSKIEEIKEIIKKKYYKTHRKRKPDREITVFQTAKLSIYNIETDSYISEKQIYDENAENIYFAPIYENDLISLDNEKNIYFKAKKNTSKFNNYIVKLNGKLDFVKEFQITHPHSILKIIYGDKFYFSIKHVEGYYLLDYSLTKLDKAQIESSEIFPPTVDLNKMFEDQINVISENIRIDKEKRSIFLQTKECCE